MTDWNSIEAITSDADAFTKFVHVLLGLYCWELITTFDFELSFITGKRTFRWPLTFYFLGRYCMLAAIIGVTITLDVKDKINCQALFIYSQATGNTAIAMASVNLCLRTIVLWNKKPIVVIPLAAMVLGHCGILLRGVIGVTVVFVPGQGCAIIGSQLPILKTIYIYSICSDFIVICLTGYKLSERMKSKTALVQILFWDGMSYFLICFLANLIALIFMALNLNPVLAVIADVPAVVVCTVASCRVVRRLSNFTTKAVEMFAPSHVSTDNARRTNTDLIQSTAQNVHIEMDAFAQRGTNVRLDKPTRYDAEGQQSEPEYKQGF